MQAALNKFYTIDEIHFVIGPAGEVKATFSYYHGRQPMVATGRTIARAVTTLGQVKSLPSLSTRPTQLLGTGLFSVALTIYIDSLPSNDLTAHYDAYLTQTLIEGE